MTIGLNEWIASRKAKHYEMRRFSCGSPEAYLLTANHSRDFSLRLGQPFGQEVMTISFKIGTSGKRKFRKLKGNLFDSGRIERFESVDPKLNPIGSWGIDLGDRFAMTSKKNAKLEGESVGKIYIRKYRKGGLEIQANENKISPICLFAICVASFVTRK
jgi:hypothetical protein